MDRLKSSMRGRWAMPIGAEARTGDGRSELFAVDIDDDLEAGE